MAPPGRQVLVFGTNCSPDTRDDTMLKALNKRMEEQMAEVFPEVVPAIEHKTYAGPRDVAELSRDEALPGSGGEFNLAISISQTGKYKPSARSPIPGLYYVGLDAGLHQEAPGLERAGGLRHQRVPDGLSVLPGPAIRRLVAAISPFGMPF